MNEPRKNLISFFHQIKFIVFKRVSSKKSLLSYNAPSFCSQIYTAWKILIGFANSLIPVDFREILVSFLSFLSQKTYSGESLRPEVILSRTYLRECSIRLGPHCIINLPFFKNPKKSEPLGVRG